MLSRRLSAADGRTLPSRQFGVAAPLLRCSARLLEALWPIVRPFSCSARAWQHIPGRHPSSAHEARHPWAPGVQESAGRATSFPRAPLARRFRQCHSRTRRLLWLGARPLARSCRPALSSCWGRLPQRARPVLLPCLPLDVESLKPSGGPAAWMALKGSRAQPCVDLRPQCAGRCGRLGTALSR